MKMRTVVIKFLSMVKGSQTHSGIKPVDLPEGLSSQTSSGPAYDALSSF